jgi:transposase
MARKSLPVIFTAAELLRLQQWLRANSTPQQVVLRARILVRAGQGQSDQQIARELKVQRRTAALWRRRVRAQGIGCVWEMAPGRGRKPRYGAEAVARLVEATLQTKPAGATHWSTRTLARAQGVSNSSRI